jgi:hypothetical protein
MMLWTAPAPARKCHGCGRYLGLPRFGGAIDADYLRSLLVAGALAAIALANKIARMAWAVMAKGERYKQPIALVA